MSICLLSIASYLYIPYHAEVCYIKEILGQGCILIIVMFPFDQKYNNDVVRLNANPAWQEENRLCVVICMYLVCIYDIKC